MRDVHVAVFRRTFQSKISSEFEKGAYIFKGAFLFLNNGMAMKLDRKLTDTAQIIPDNSIWSATD